MEGKKSCINCAECESVIDCDTFAERHRCALDREMQVNGRMWCEAWDDKAVVMPVVDFPKHVRTLIRM